MFELFLLYVDLALPVISLLFWLWMLIDCVLHRNDPEWTTWLIVILIFNFFAAIAYFIVKFLPRSRGAIAPRFFSRFTRKQELWTAEAAARNIGKDHQYVELGNLLLEMRLLPRAEESFNTAIQKNESNLQARWGLAQVAILQKQLEPARDQLQVILAKEPDFKFGDASAAYGKVLFELKDFEAAKAHLDQHVKRWTSPESRVIAAEVAIQLGDLEAARSHLEAMLNGIRGGPQFHYKNNRRYVRKAERLLQGL